MTITDIYCWYVAENIVEILLYYYSSHLLMQENFVSQVNVKQEQSLSPVTQS